jgi:hypothetical protein
MGSREHRLRARMTIDCHETAVQIDVLRPRAGPVASRVTLAGHRLIRGGVLAATLFAHEPEAFREHGSAGLYDHGGPLAASMSTISPG